MIVPRRGCKTGHWEWTNSLFPNRGPYDHNPDPTHSPLPHGAVILNGVLYIGIRRDLQKRIFQHKWKEDYGFTARYNCDRLVWFESHDEVAKAITREKELKGWRRARKIALIESMNPAWTDLSREWYDYEPADYRRALDRMDN